MELSVLQSAFKRAAWYSLTLTAIVTVVGTLLASFIAIPGSDTNLIVPLPMFFSHYVFSERFFGFWISISM